MKYWAYQRALNHNIPPTMMRLSTLALPRRSGRRIQTIPNTRNDASDDKLSESIRGSLENSSNNRDRGAKEYSSSTTKRIPNPDTGNGTWKMLARAS
jgi:hypothetical protein